MKKLLQRLLCLLLCLALVAPMVPKLEVKAVTIDGFVEIWTVEDFLEIADAPDASYRLMNSISLGNYTPLSEFSGVLDGNGCQISYSITEPAENVGSYGLFGNVNNAEILNLTVNANINLKMQGGRPYYFGALAGSGSGSVGNVSLNGSIRVSGHPNAVYLGLAFGLGSPNLYDVRSSMDIVAESDAPIYYKAMNGTATECDVSGSVSLMGSVTAAYIFADLANDCVSDQNLYICTDSPAYISGVNEGNNNKLTGEYFIDAVYEYASSTGVNCLNCTTNSSFDGKVTLLSNGGGYHISGATGSSFVEVNMDLSVVGKCNAKASAFGLNNCTDSRFNGSISILTTGTNKLGENVNIYGLHKSSRSSFTGSINARHGGNLYVYGANEASDCNVNADLSSIGGNVTYCYGLKGITRGSFSGSAYAKSTNYFARAYGGTEGSHNTVNANVEAFSTESGSSAHGVMGSNSSYSGTVRSNGYSLGVSGAYSIGKASLYGSSTVALSNGNHSYFSGSLHATAAAQAFDRSVGSSNSAVQASITVDGEKDVWATTWGGFFSGSVKVTAATGSAGINGLTGTVSQREFGYSNTLENIVAEYGSYVYLSGHTYKGFCDPGNNHERIIETNYYNDDADARRHHYRTIVNVSYVENKIASMDDIDWSNSSVDPYQEALKPEMDPTSYTIRLLDLNDRPVANASITFNGQSYVTDSSGCFLIEDGPAIISPLNVQMANAAGQYETVVERSAFYPIPDAVNDLCMRYNVELDLTFLGNPNAESGTGTASGAEVDVMGKKVPLVTFPMNVDIEGSLGDVTFATKWDPATNLLYTTIGLGGGRMNHGEFDEQTYNDLVDALKGSDQEAWSKANRAFAKAESKKAGIGFGAWDAKLAGYANLQLADSRQGFDIVDGGLLWGAKGELRHVYPFYPGIYGTLGITGELEAKLYLTRSPNSTPEELQLQTKGSVTMKPRGEAAIGAGLRTARLYAEIGVGMEMEAELSAPLESLEESLTVTGVVDAFGEISCLVFSNRITLAKASAQFWPRTAAYSLARMMEQGGSGYSIAPREYAKSNVMLTRSASGGSAQYMGIDATAYPYAEVGLYPLENGRFLLLYTDDDLNRESADRSALRACIGTEVDGQLVFGEAITIESDGTGDYGFHAAVSGNSVAVVWQDANKTFGSGENLSVSDLAAQIHLSQTVLDCGGDTVAVGDIASVANQGSYPYNMAVYYTGSEIRTAWTTTDNPDPSSYADNETETVWYSEAFGQEGTAVAQSQEAVSGVALVRESLMWTAGTEENVTLWNRSSDGTVSEADSGNILSLQSNGRQYCYSKDNTLYLGQDRWGDASTATVNGGISNILRLSADGTIYGAKLGMEKSRILTLESGKALPIGEFEGYISSWDAAKGHIVTILRTGFAENDTASFRNAAKVELEDMKADQVVFDNTAVTPGSKTEMTVKVTNDGYNAIEKLQVSVVAEDGTVLLQEELSPGIQPGEDANVSFDVPIPSGFQPQNVTVTLGDQSQQVTLGGSNLEVTADWNASDADTVSVIVRNTGLGSAGGRLELTDGAGNVLCSQEVTVSEGGVEMIRLDLGSYHTENADLMVTLTDVAGEVTDADNSAAVALRPVTARRLRVSGSIRMQPGETRAIEVHAIPEGSILPGLTYSSSDEAIASVDAAGNILAGDPGEATVTVTAEDGSSYSVSVTVSASTPDQPTEPEEPTQPTEPENPTEPSEPEEPTKPTEPENPTEPSEPEEPTQPSEPEEPTTPSEPEEPTEPSEPGESEVSRIAGSTRFETAFAAADAMKQNLGLDKFEAVIVASGTNFADALSGSYLAAVTQAPILLSHSAESVNNRVKDYIRANLMPYGTVYILGGPAAVPETMEQGLDGFVVKRLAGNTRFDTNLEILKEAGVGQKDILICTAFGFADSLSASAAQRPILLVGGSLNEAQKNFLSGLKGNKLYIIGGTSAVSEALQQEVSAYGQTERIGGANRFATSVLIAEQFFGEPDAVVLAYAMNFPDGLCGGALASTLNAPLVLTMTNAEQAAADYVQGKKLNKGIVLGGEGLISEDAVGSIF